MPTPLFKLLANSIRLGQPPEAVTAIKALVEVIAHQEGELNDLRQRLSLLNSRLMFLEAKTSRMEAVSLQGPSSSSSPPVAYDHIVMPQREVHGPVYSGGMQQGGQAHGLVSPTHLPKAEPLPSRVERPRSQFPAAFNPGPSAEDSHDADAAGGTLVVSRADIDAVVRQEIEHEAPFPLAPPGGHRPHSENHPAMPFKPAPFSQQPSGGDLDAGGPRSARPDPGRGSISDPYVPIEDLVADTFSSTGEVDAVQLAGLRTPEARTPEARTPEAHTPPPRPPQVRTPDARPPEKAHLRPQIVDEPSFDEVLTSVHKRKP